MFSPNISEISDNEVCVFYTSAALSRTSDLLGLNSDQLAEVLTHRSMILRGEEISTPLTVEQVSKWQLPRLYNNLNDLYKHT